MQHKDHRLAGELGRALDVPLPLNDLAVELYERIRAAGGGDRDIVEAFRFYERLARADLRHPGRRTDGEAEPVSR